MSDLMRLEHSVAPWLGSADATVVVEYRYYDVPTCGVVSQGSQEYLFWCATRSDESPTVWMYTAITPEDRAKIETSGTEGFDQRLQAFTMDGWGMMALATENIGIVDFVEVDLSPTGILAAFQLLLGRLDALAQQAHERSATLAAH